MVIFILLFSFWLGPIMESNTLMVDRHNDDSEKELNPKPDLVTARFLSVLPGAAQVYKNHQISAALFMSGFIYTTNGFVQKQNRLSDNRSAYSIAISNYESATIPAEAMLWGDEVERLNSRHRTLQRHNNQYVAALLTIYALNVLDAWFIKPKEGYRSAKFEMQPSAEVIGSSATIGLSMKVKF